MTKKRKIGFTLIELMGIIIILSLLSLLVIPGIDRAIKQFKNDAYEDQIKNIKIGAADWAVDNIPKYALNDGDAITITLAQLKMSNLFEPNIINPKTDEPFADDMIINIIRKKNSFSFDVDSNSGVIAGLTDNAPILTINGSYVVRMYEDFGYVDQGATAKTSAGVAIPSTSITKVITKNGSVVPAITDMSGSYTISYSVTDSGITRVIYRVIIFDELVPSTPALCFTFDSGYGRITNYNPALAGCGYDVRIPRTIGGVTVREIGSSAFLNKQLTSVIIPSSVVSIFFNAFKNNQLTSVIIPSSVATIGDSAFQNNQLAIVAIPNSVTLLGNYTFDHNQLVSVSISTSLIQISPYTFSNNQLTSVTIPDNIVVVDYEAFSYNQLTSVTIPSSVTSIGGGAFSRNQLTSIAIPSSVTSIGGNAFSYNQLTDINIPTGVTIVSGGAFQYNQLTSVTIPSTVTSIEAYAFRANRLTNVTIPSVVTVIGEEAFANNRLTTVTIPSGVTVIKDGSFKSNQLTSITIPVGVTLIEASAFASNQLTSVTIPPLVTAIYDQAFISNQLTSIMMQRSNTSLGSNLLLAFNNDFRTTYMAGGTGTYVGTQTGTWVKS